MSVPGWEDGARRTHATQSEDELGLRRPRSTLSGPERRFPGETVLPAPSPPRPHAASPLKWRPRCLEKSASQRHPTDGRFPLSSPCSGGQEKPRASPHTAATTTTAMETIAVTMNVCGCLLLLGRCGKLHAHHFIRCPQDHALKSPL